VRRDQNNEEIENLTNDAQFGDYFSRTTDNSAYYDTSRFVFTPQLYQTDFTTAKPLKSVKGVDITVGINEKEGLYVAFEVNISMLINDDFLLDPATDSLKKREFQIFLLSYEVDFNFMGTNIIEEEMLKIENAKRHIEWKEANDSGIAQRMEEYRKRDIEERNKAYRKEEKIKGGGHWMKIKNYLASISSDLKESPETKVERVNDHGKSLVNNDSRKRKMKLK
jgi:hypothetical protein